MTREFTRRTTLATGAAVLGASLPAVSATPDSETDGATLYAARDVPVGTVSVDQDGGELTVTYDTADSAWAITEAHLHVETDVSGIPTNNGGNPKIGHFDLAREPDTATDTLEFDGIAVDEGVEGVVLAAHAEVRRGGRTEGAWAGSEPITDRGNWARYFEYELAEPEPGIRGTLYEPDGEPATDDRLVLLGPKGGDDFESTSIYTDEDGRFSETVSEPGTYSLGYYQRERWNVETPERDGSPDVYTLGPVEIGNGMADLGRIDLPNAHLLDVRVVDEDGAPVADAPVNFYDEGTWGISWNHSTNADGYFQYEGLDVTGIELLGEVTIQVWEPGTDPEPGTHVAQRRIELDDSRTEEFVLEGSGDDPGGPLEISGAIYEPDGEPATDDPIHCAGPFDKASNFSVQTSTDDVGRFSVDLEEPGEYSVGYYRDSSTGPSTRDGTPDVYELDRTAVDGAVDLGDVDLPEAHVLDVRVVDADGNPIDGAPVNFYHNGTWGIGRSNTTNVDGYFQYRNLAETGAELVGEITIQVWHPDEDDPQWDNYVAEREIELTESRTEEFVLDA